MLIGGLALLLGSAPSASAVDDVPSTVTDADGVVWRVLTWEEYTADPRVREFDAVVRDQFAGSFRYASQWESEGDYAYEYGIHDGRLTRTAKRGYSGPWTVTYRRGDRICTRQEPSRTKALARARDRRSSFTCRDLRPKEIARYGAPDGAIVRRVAPIPDSGASSPTWRYLITAQPESPAPGMLAQLTTRGVTIDLLRNEALDYGPRTYEQLEIGPNRIESTYFDSNGYTSTSSWHTVDTSRVPNLRRFSPLK